MTDRAPLPSGDPPQTCTKLPSGFCTKHGEYHRRLAQLSVISEKKEMRKSVQLRGPRMSPSVARGLDAMVAAINAGDMMAGDLKDQADDVYAAMKWVDSITITHSDKAPR